MKVLVLIVGLVVVSLVSSEAIIVSGSVLYVSPSVGRDASGCGPRNQPCASFAYTIKMSGPSDTIIPLPGTYKGGDNCNIEVQRGLNIQAQSSDVTIDLSTCGAAQDNFFLNITTNEPVQISNLKIMNGVASSGGAITITGDGVVTVSKSSFINNSATNNGGAIHTGYHAISLTIDTCEFIGNSARVEGAAINWSNGGHFVVRASVFLNNSATRGAIRMYYGTSVITHSEFGYNYAYEGAAIQALYEVNVYVSNCNFHSNHASSFGGAIAGNRGEDSALIFVENSVFTANQADGEGGGVGILNTPTVISQCRFDHNVAKLGGAVNAQSVGLLSSSSSDFPLPPRLNIPLQQQVAPAGWARARVMAAAAGGRSLQLLDSSFNENSGEVGGDIAVTNFQFGSRGCSAANVYLFNATTLVPAAY